MNFQAFKSKYQKAPVEEYPNKVTDAPLVSVCVVTYQHKDYVRQCLDGILMQKTDFPFEVLLGEDASTDGTREICIEYAERYPDKIRLFLHERANNIAIGGYPTGRFNFLYSLYSTKGKYIALCDGDDYWTDPNKLQKQVEIMQTMPNIGLCYTLVRTEYEPSGQPYSLDKLTSNSFSRLADYIEYGSPFINTSTWLLDKSLLKSFEMINNIVMGDLQIALHVLKLNKTIYCLNEIMAVYRVLDQSASHLNNKKREVEFFYNKLAFETTFISEEALKIKILRQFYSKYFNLLPLLHLNFKNRFEIVKLLYPLKSKTALIKYLMKVRLKPRF